MWINYFLIFICNIFPILFIYLRVKSINRNPRYPCSLKVVIPRISMNMYGCCNHILPASLHLCVKCCVLPCWLLCAMSLSWLPQAEHSHSKSCQACSGNKSNGTLAKSILLNFSLARDELTVLSHPQNQLKIMFEFTCLELPTQKNSPQTCLHLNSCLHFFSVSHFPSEKVAIPLCLGIERHKWYLQLYHNWRLKKRI